MDAIEKDLASRKEEIKKEVKLLFEANMKITDWDVPEADEAKAAKLLLAIMQEALDELKSQNN